MSQTFDRYSESVGHLVMTEDGAVTNVSWFDDVFLQRNIHVFIDMSLECELLPLCTALLVCYAVVHWPHAVCFKSSSTSIYCSLCHIIDCRIDVDSWSYYYYYYYYSFVLRYVMYCAVLVFAFMLA